MTQDEIVKANEKIARFMGWEKDKQGFWIGCKQGIHYALSFHKSWDELMPVVEKIEDLGYYTQSINLRSNPDAPKFFSITTREHTCISDAYAKEKVDAFFECIVKFIDWYNENEVTINIDSGKLKRHIPWYERKTHPFEGLTTPREYEKPRMCGPECNCDK